VGVVVSWRVCCNLITRKPGTRVPVLIPDGYPGTKIPESPSTNQSPTHSGAITVSNEFITHERPGNGISGADSGQASTKCLPNNELRPKTSETIGSAYR